jgi:hypothetical protein
MVSSGINYLPQTGWKVIPALGIGISYYHVLSGDVEGGLKGPGIFLKIGIFFSIYRVEELLSEVQ